MPKHKSSASSATKKKHARRAAARDEALLKRAELLELQDEAAGAGAGEDKEEDDDNEDDEKKKKIHQSSSSQGIQESGGNVKKNSLLEDEIEHTEPGTISGTTTTSTSIPSSSSSSSDGDNVEATDNNTQQVTTPSKADNVIISQNPIPDSASSPRSSAAPSPSPLRDRRGKKIGDFPPATKGHRGEKKKVKGTTSKSQNSDASNKGSTTASASATATTSAAVDKQQQQQQNKKAKKQSKKHAKGQAPPPPRKKQYIPPPKPANTNLDPVDIYGLGVLGAGHVLVPPEKIVTLRLLNKKDSLSVERGLEELYSWLVSLDKQDPEAEPGYRKNDVVTVENTSAISDSEELDSLSQIAPIWIHHLPKLLSHTSRKVRLITCTVHKAFLSGSPGVRNAVLPALINPATVEREGYLSAQLCATFDADRQIRTLSTANWEVLTSYAPVTSHLDELLRDLNDDIQEGSSSSQANEIEQTRKQDDAERLAAIEDKERKTNYLASCLDAYHSLLSFKTSNNSHLYTGVVLNDHFWTLIDAKVMDAPQVRRIVWRILATYARSLHEQENEELQTILDEVAGKAPLIAFSERDLLTQTMALQCCCQLFTQNPRLWQRHSVRPNSNASLRNGCSSDSESDTPSDIADESDGASISSNVFSPVLSSFLDLLQHGLYGNATAGYQLVTRLISTIPSPIKERPTFYPLLLTSYWSAYTAAAIESSSSALQAFTEALVSLMNDFRSPAAIQVSADYLVTLWRYYLGLTPAPRRNLRFSYDNCIANFMLGLTYISRGDRFIYDETWQKLRECAFECLQNEAHLRALAIAVTGPLPEGDVLCDQVQDLLLDIVDRISKDTPSPVRSMFIVRTLGSHSLRGIQKRSVLEATLTYATRVDLSESELLLAYLESCPAGSDAQTTVWSAIGEQMNVTVRKGSLDALLPYLVAFSDAGYVSQLPNLRMDQVLQEAATVQQEKKGLEVLQYLFRSPAPIVSEAFPTSLVASIGDKLDRQLHDFLRTTDSATGPRNCECLLEILDLASNAQLESSTNSEVPIASIVAQYAILAPFVLEGLGDIGPKSRHLANRLLNGKGLFSNEDILAVTMAKLSVHVTDGISQMSVECLCEAALRCLDLSGASRSSISNNFLPTRNAMDQLADELLSEAPLRSTGFSESLEKFSPSFSSSQNTKDRTAPFIRAMFAWLKFLTHSRSLAQSTQWILPHCALLSIILCDQSDPQSTRAHASFDCTDAEALAQLSHRVAGYVCSRALAAEPDDWQTTTISILDKPETASIQTSPLTLVLVSSLKRAMEMPSSFSSSILSQLIGLVTKQASLSQKEQEAWVTLARRWLSKNSLVSLSVLSALDTCCSQAPNLPRWIGELVADLTSLKKSEISKKALPLLRCLVATVELADNFTITGNRAIFLLQAFQRWEVFSLEEAGREKVEGADTLMAHILEVATHLAPFIQDLSGSHWEYVFDLADYLVETSDPSSDDEPQVSRMLAVCDFMQEVSSRVAVNKTLRQLIRSSYQRNTGLLGQWLIAGDMSNRMCQVIVPRVLPLLDHGESFNVANLGQLILVMEKQAGIARAAAYHLCVATIRRQVENLITDAGFTTGKDNVDHNDVVSGLTTNSIIPGQLLRTEMPTSKDSLGSLGIEHSTVHVLCLWNLTLEYLVNSTPAMRTTLTDHIKRSSLLPTCILPIIHEALHLSDRHKSIDLSGWQVEDFVLSDIEDRDPSSVTHYAAYTYYRTLRSVPSLVRADWEAIRDRQLSAAIEAFTSKVFSPLLIVHELTSLSDGDGARDLNDEDMTVKILANVNEVKATYVVDEQPMELSIRIPSNFPLSPVELKDTKRIGVPEATWRAWLLNVQLIISQQNGSIADALTLFKTNASRHFEGVEACAICYSVVSVTDRSMPSKRCRTCKQLFHSSCLYKWFSTSHGSSCPLCRSLF